MSGTTPTPYVMSLTAAEVETLLLSVYNKIDVEAIRVSLINASDDSIPTTKAVADALAVINGDMSSLGNLAVLSSLDLGSDYASGILSVSKGGTGASTPVGARNALGVLSAAETQTLIGEMIPEVQAIDLGSAQATGVLPVTKGGTGGSTPVAARSGLGVLSAEESETLVEDKTRLMLARLASEAGFNLVAGSFEEGGSLVNPEDVLWYRGDGKYYSWFNKTAKTVNAGSTPATSGGVGTGAWVDRTDLTLRSEINIVQKRFACVADMVASTSLTIGKIVETVGYYNGWAATIEGARGGNYYEIVPASMGTIDGGSFIALSNGLRAKGLFVDGMVNVDQFGAIADNNTIDNAAAITSALFVKKDVKLGRGMYYIANTIYPAYGSKLTGCGSLTYDLYADSGIYQTTNKPAIELNGSVGRVCLKDFVIRGNTSGTDQDGIRLISTGTQSIFENIWIQGMGGNGFNATGTATWGIDLVNAKNIKIEDCSLYGFKMNLDSANTNNFNTSTFELIECKGNNLGGFYIDKSQACVFLRCHAFQNKHYLGNQCHGYTIGANTQNLMFISCWAESNGEVSPVDGTHTSCGFSIKGGTGHKITSPHFFASSISINIENGDNIVVDSPYIDSPLAWATSADVIISATATNCKVVNFSNKSSSVIANFSSTSYIEFKGDATTSGRLPFNTNMRKGFRGKAYCYKQGTVSPSEHGADVNATAGNGYATWLTFNALKVGDNITIPGAGVSGAALSAQVLSMDLSTNRIYFNSSIATTVNNVVASTTRALIYSDIYDNAAPTSGYWNEGDRVNALSPSYTNHPGWLCTVSGTPGTWKQMAPLI